MMRVASLLVAFSLLFSDAPVCAEGAWVVWRTSKGTWEPIRVWATAAYVLDSFALLAYLEREAGMARVLSASLPMSDRRDQRPSRAPSWRSFSVVERSRNCPRKRRLPISRNAVRFPCSE